MTVASSTRPSIEANPAGSPRLQGCWTLDHAADMGAALRAAPAGAGPLDATGVEKRRRSRSKYGVKRPKAAK